MMRIISGRQTRYRFGANVFAEQKVFIISQAQCLIVVPIIPSGRSLFDIAYRVFPPVHRVSVSGFKEPPCTKHPPGKRINLGLRSAISVAMSFRMPPGRLRNVFSGKRDTISRYSFPFPFVTKHKSAAGIGGIGRNVSLHIWSIRLNSPQSLPHHERCRPSPSIVTTTGSSKLASLLHKPKTR